MRAQGVTVENIRFIDHDVATGVYPDMREHGWERDAWPERSGPRSTPPTSLSSADRSGSATTQSITRQLIERLYAHDGGCSTTKGSTSTTARPAAA